MVRLLNRALRSDCASYMIILERRSVAVTISDTGFSLVICPEYKRPLQIRHHHKRQSRHRVGDSNLAILHPQLAPSDYVSPTFERKTFRQFDCCIFPTIANWRKADSRGKARHDDDDGVPIHLPSKGDAAIAKRAIRAQR